MKTGRLAGCKLDGIVAHQHSDYSNNNNNNKKDEKRRRNAEEIGLDCPSYCFTEREREREKMGGVMGNSADGFLQKRGEKCFIMMTNAGSLAVRLFPAGYGPKDQD